MEEKIDSEETLYRAVLPVIVWDEENGKFSTALFKDDKGVSVDRQGGRTSENIYLNFKEKFHGKKLKGMVPV